MFELLGTVGFLLGLLGGNGDPLSLNVLLGVVSPFLAFHLVNDGFHVGPAEVQRWKQSVPTTKARDTPTITLYNQNTSLPRTSATETWSSIGYEPVTRYPKIIQPRNVEH